MSDVLAAICADKRIEVDRRKSAISPAAIRELADKANAADPPRGFARRLAEVAQAGRFALIAEIKRASPSKGLIRADFDPPSLAKAYRDGGATCLSVLTDEKYFQGKGEYLTAARRAVALPALCKDFILDPYQVCEARALGADCILLIMAALDDKEAGALEALAAELSMDVLIEVHDESEMRRALKLRSPLIGVNNRDLKSLNIDLSTTERLATMAPGNRMLVAESGLYKTCDLERMRRAGAGAFLVGESLMREQDVAAATRALLGQYAPDIAA